MLEQTKQIHCAVCAVELFIRFRLPTLMVHNARTMSVLHCSDCIHGIRMKTTLYSLSVVLNTTARVVFFDVAVILVVGLCFFSSPCVTNIEYYLYERTSACSEQVFIQTNSMADFNTCTFPLQFISERTLRQHKYKRKLQFQLMGSKCNCLNGKLFHVEIK